MEVALLSCWLYCVDTGLFVCGFAGLCFWPGPAFAFFCIFFACLRVWPGKAFVSFLLFVSSCLPVRLAGLLFVSSSVCCRRRRRLLPVRLILRVLLMQLSTLSLLGYEKLLRSAYVIRFVCVCVCVCVRSRGLGLASFPFGFPGFYLLSVSLVWGAVVDVLLSCLVSAVLLRASAVVSALVFMQLSYVCSESR